MFKKIIMLYKINIINIKSRIMMDKLYKKNTIKKNKNVLNIYIIIFLRKEFAYSRQ